MSDAKTNELFGKVPEVMKVAAEHLRALSAANVELEEKIAAQERLIQHMKIARRMEERGHRADLDYESKVAYVSTIPGEKLAAFEQAIEMTAGGDVSIGTVTAPEDDGTEGETSGLDRLDRFVMSGQALS